jgi:hypothetical protein
VFILAPLNRPDHRVPVIVIDRKVAKQELIEIILRTRAATLSLSLKEKKGRVETGFIRFRRTTSKNDVKKPAFSY